VRVPVTLMLVLAARLALATAAAAQIADDELPPAPIPPRVEIAGAAGLMIGYPEFGVLASVPTGSGPAIEMAIGWLPRVVYDVEQVVAQAQFRVPFRPYLRSRRSLLVGATRISARKRHELDSAFWGREATVTFPHAGVSLQWPMGRHADFRFDAVGLFTFDGELPLIGRATTAFVWHP
jgi:hypothetical protein